MMRHMNERGELTLFLGRNETLRRLLVCTIKVDGSLLYLTKLQLSLTLFGKRLRVPLPTRILRLYGAYLGIPHAIPAGSKSASPAGCIAEPGGRTKSTREASPSPITN